MSKEIKNIKADQLAFMRELIREVMSEEGKGLWHNIRAKRARGEKPSHGNSKAFKSAVKAGKDILKKEVAKPASEKSGKKLGTNLTKTPAERQFVSTYIKQYNEGKYNDTSKFDLVKKNPFDIKKLVDKGIIFLTKPGDGKGGVEEPNWEGDASVITLYNMQTPDPWMKKAVKSLLPKSIPYIQKDQDKLLYNGKYNQILWSIHKKGLNPEEFFLKESRHSIKYTQPNFEFEWEEANRYPEFEKMGEKGWVDVAKKGKPISYSIIKDVLGNVDLNFKGLEEPKKERFQAAFNKGVIEMPIAVKFKENDYDLVAGNTRLSGLVKNGVDPKIWVVDISSIKEITTPADPSEVDSKELQMGIEVEMEHTDSKKEAKVIALQHLAEDPKYYTKLKSLNLEDIHEPVKPGILKKRLGKLSCSKVRQELSKLEGKGTHYAKALQRYLNYHCKD